VGVAGFGQFQTNRDRGDDLDPHSFDGQGIRSRSFGAGREVKFIIPDMHGYISLNYIKEFSVSNRPEGHIMTVNFVFAFN